MANIVLVTLGSDGDIRPFVRLGRALKARGHSACLLTHADYAELAAQNGLDFVALDTHAEYEQFIAEAPSFNSPTGLLAGYQKYFLPKLLATHQLIETGAHADETVLVAHHNMRLAAQLSAEKLGRPLVIAFAWPSQITNLSLLAEFFQTQISPELNRLRGELGLAPVKDWAAWLLQSPVLNLALWPDWFASAGPGWPPELIRTGFLVDAASAPLPPEVEAFLEGTPPPVLITGGTGNFVSSDFYTASAEGVRRVGRRGILVACYPDYVPANLPGEILRINYLPYGTALPRMGAIIHHGGIGTCAQALAAGIPQLILGVGADRPDNAFRLQHLGVAEFLPPPRWQPASVAEALQRLLSQAEVRERCQALAERIRTVDSAPAACEAIEKFIREGAARPAGDISAERSTTLPAAGPAVDSELRQRLDQFSPEKLELLARWTETKA